MIFSSGYSKQKWKQELRSRRDECSVQALKYMFPELAKLIDARFKTGMIKFEYVGSSIIPSKILIT